MFDTKTVPILSHPFFYVQLCAARIVDKQRVPQYSTLRRDAPPTGGPQFAIQRSSALSQYQKHVFICTNGPYCGVQAADADVLFEQHIVGGQPVERLLSRLPPGDNKQTDA